MNDAVETMLCDIEIRSAIDLSWLVYSFRIARMEIEAFNLMRAAADAVVNGAREEFGRDSVDHMLIVALRATLRAMSGEPEVDDTIDKWEEIRAGQEDAHD